MRREGAEAIVRKGCGVRFRLEELLTGSKLVNSSLNGIVDSTEGRFDVESASQAGKLVLGKRGLGERVEKGSGRK